MRGSKSNMKLGSNIISSPPKQTFLVEFNKENECENVALTKPSLLKDGLTRNQNIDESYSLDKVELLDISTLNLDCTASWLLDGKDKCEDKFDMMAWLKEEEDNKDVNKFTSKSTHQSNISTASPLKDHTSTSASLQYETLKKMAKLSEDAQTTTFISPSPLSPYAEKSKHLGMLVSGEAKSQFGLRGFRPQAEGGPSNTTDGFKRNDKLAPTKFLPLSLPKEITEKSDLADANSSFLNKSFDDVLSAVTFSGDGVMQKSISRSQENCFSPVRTTAVGNADSPLLGQVAGGSMNKLSNVEEVANMARLQADHLRQTVRSGFPSKRLSQSTDRLRQVSNYSLMPDATQFKKVPSASDSDDSLVAKFKGPTGAKHLAEPSSMTHPRSLPSIIPQNRIFLAQSKLVLPRQDQPSKESKPVVKATTTKISAPNNQFRTLQGQSRVRNFSSTRASDVKTQDKQGATANRSFDGTPPPGQRSLGRIANPKQASRLQPPPGRRARAEMASENVDMNVSIKSDQQDAQYKTSSSIGSSSPSNHSSAEEGSSKPSSIPVSRGIPRFSSIPRPKTKQFSK